MRLMILGVIIIVLGFLPIYFSGINIGTLEGATSLFFVGLLIFLIGLGLRRLRKVFEPSQKTS